MNSQIVGLRVAGTIFGLACLIQLLRLVTQAEVSISGHLLPLWASGLAVVITAVLSLWMWKLSQTGTR